MWPDHCVEGTFGAEYHKDILIEDTDKEVLKGTTKMLECYSGFGDFGEDTGLKKILQDEDINEVYCCGLALDYCVGSTAVDSAKNGFTTFIFEDATRSVAEESEKTMRAKLKENNVEFKQTNEVWV